MAANPRIKKVNEKHPASSINTPKTAVSVYRATQQSSEVNNNWNKFVAEKRKLPKKQKKQALMNVNQRNIRKALTKIKV